MTIQLNGKQHPVKFGMGALYQYERKTGRSAISDFQQVAGGSPSITMVVDLIYSGIVCGYRDMMKRLPDFGPDELADWLDNDTITQMMTMFADSFAPASDEPGNVVRLTDNQTPEA